MGNKSVLAVSETKANRSVQIVELVRARASFAKAGIEGSTKVLGLVGRDDLIESIFRNAP